MQKLAALLLSLALAACSQGGGGPVNVMDGDSFLGNADAKVTVIEYAAPTCPVCKGWHDQVWAGLKSAYIDTNKIKFVLREYPAHNLAEDAAIFAIARCSGQKNYFAVIDEAFARQTELETAHQRGEAMPAIKSLGQKFGLSGDQVEACIKDKKNLDRIFAVRAIGDAAGVTGTPTLFINDVKVQDASLSGMKAQIDSLLGEAPAAPAAPAPAQQ